ncbi:olfactory receptor 52M1-like [Spea bombifrons]|uniref:olfactory receptor 52M1-like n=1 Tax=Spea bombifrons TaxID=233779 RepID=UPI0023499944|nr:olfactory receptor 52M1-like [Spea bombifrons]
MPAHCTVNGYVGSPEVPGTDGAGDERDCCAKHLESSGALILLGIPGLESLHVWISILFFIIFFIAVVGNYSVLLIIVTDVSLHQPMYLFFTMLAFVDLVLANTTMPKLLGIFWCHSNDIDFHTCLLQMFFVHAFSTIESGIFVAMAFDRYVAICYPLRYVIVLSPGVIVKSGVLAVISGVAYILPLSLLALRFYEYRSWENGLFNGPSWFARGTQIPGGFAANLINSSVRSAEDIRLRGTSGPQMDASDLSMVPGAP